MPGNRGWMWVALIAVAAFAVASPLVIPDRSLRVAFLDVGQGACTVIRTPSGKIMVVDCGSSSGRSPEFVAKNVVAPYLDKIGASRIDLAVLTHPHADHCNAFAALLRLKPAAAVMDIEYPHTSQYYIDFRKQVKISKATRKKAERGIRIDLGDGVEVYVLSPDPGVEYPDLNDRSAVLRVVYKRTAFLLSADATVLTESGILRHSPRLRSDVLQVGHHGSDTSTSDEWLAAIRPRFAVISCGRANVFGLPSKRVVARLRDARATVYRTDKHGAVVFSTDGKDLSVRTYAPRRYRY